MLQKTTQNIINYVIVQRMAELIGLTQKAVDRKIEDDMTKVTLQPDELEQLTGYEQATKQLNLLHKRGFTRAYIGRRGVVLERAHYEAVCQGLIDRPVAKEANLGFFRGRK